MKEPAADYDRIFSSLLEKTQLTEEIKTMVSDAMDAGVELRYENMIDGLAEKDLDGQQLLEHGETILKFVSFERKNRGNFMHKLYL